MKLVAFGDSFVEGLIKLPQENTVFQRKQINFATQISKINSRIESVDNYGLRGNANQKIAYDAYSHIRDNSYNTYFYLIAFSGSDRASHYYPDTDEYHCTNDSLLAKEQPQFIQEAVISLLHNVLHLKKIPHLFCSSFETYRSEMIDYKRFPFVNKTLAEISGELAPCYHPTEKGHINIAKYLNNLINIEIDKYKN